MQFVTPYFRDSRHPGRPDTTPRWLSLLLLLILSSGSAAVDISSHRDFYPLTNRMSWYADSTGQLGLQQINTPQYLQQFQPHHSHSFSLGYVEYPVWFHVSLHRVHTPVSSEFDQAPWQALIDYAPLDLIDIYLVREDGSVKHVQMGDSLPFEQRKYKHHNFVFPVLIAEGETVELFICVKTSSSMQMPLSLSSPEGSMALNNGQNSLYGVYFGVMAIMLFYNLFIFFILKDRSYLYYVLHVASFSLLQASISGHAYQYLWSNAVYWQQLSVPLLIFINCLNALLFTRNFLDIRDHSPITDRLVSTTAGAVIFCGVASLFLPYKITLLASFCFTFITMLLIVTCGMMGLANGYRMARTFLLAWSAQLAGAAIHALTAVDILPQHPLSLKGGLIGSSIEVVLLSLALADRFKMKIRESESIANETSKQLFLANQQLNDALQAQKRLVQVKDNFLASISHELRTPMNGVEGSLGLITPDNLTERQKSYISAAKRSARDMTGKIDSILRLSEIESGELLIKRERLEIREVLNPLIVDARNRCMLKGLELGFHIDRTVPAIIEGDREQVIHVVRQLLDNALKFTQHGRVQVYVSTGWDETAHRDMLCIAIIDTGSGMPTGQVTSIFNAFDDPLHTVQHNPDGLGIGLAICKQLAGLMGGELSLDSTEGEGSELIFKLPLHTLPDIPDSDEPEIDIRRDRKTVLIAEDNPVNQMVLRGVLENMGCLTLTVANGREVCEILALQPVDLILMDCQMPLMDGFETTRKIRDSQTAYNSIPIIAVTANALSADSRLCLEAGMNDYIKKPIDRLVLETKIKHWLKCGKMAAL